MKNRILLLSIAVVSLCSCHIVTNSVAPLPTLEYSFAPREANYLWVRPTVENGRFEIVISSYNRMIRTGFDYTETWQQIDTSVSSIEYTLSRLKTLSGSPVKFVSIEEQMEYLEYEKNNPHYFYDHPEALLPLLIEYRTDEVADLRITADRTFLGEPAGTLLNRLFLIRSARSDQNMWFPVPYRYKSPGDDSDIHGPNLFFEIQNPYPLAEILVDRMTVPASVVLREAGASHPLTDEELQATITVELTTTAGVRFRASHKIDTEKRYIAPFSEQNEFLASIGDEYLALRVDE